ncbi:MAG: hypothetical protein QOF70_2768, partial [Acetobacteraceae bacterium]|nr:hypothetical protein [Acetobacteraceae bacterium]
GTPPGHDANRVSERVIRLAVYKGFVLLHRRFGAL